MRKWWLLLPACLWLAVPAYAELDTAALVAKAQQAYAAGDFDAAVDAYATLTWEGGARDADVWYNAGNAYARAGEHGAAIAAYRRALELDPGHADAAANLAYVRHSIPDAPAPQAESFLAWLVRPATWLPLHAWRMAVGVAWIAFWAAFAVSVWRPRRWRGLALGAGLICGLAAAGWGADRLGRALEPRAIVTAIVAPLRTGPGSDYLVTFSLPDGAECYLQTRQAGWVQLRLPDGATGWTEAERVLTLPVGDPQPGRAPARWEETA